MTSHLTLPRGIFCSHVTVQKRRNHTAFLLSLAASRSLIYHCHCNSPGRCCHAIVAFSLKLQGQHPLPTRTRRIISFHSVSQCLHSASMEYLKIHIYYLFGCIHTGDFCCVMWNLPLGHTDLVALGHVWSQFPYQGLNLCPLHCKVDFSPLNQQGSPCNTFIIPQREIIDFPLNFQASYTSEPLQSGPTTYPTTQNTTSDRAPHHLLYFLTQSPFLLPHTHRISFLPSLVSLVLDLFHFISLSLPAPL